jgi:hypothetical protein
MLLQTTPGVACLLVLLAAFAGLGLALLRALRVATGPLDGLYAVAIGWGAATLLATVGSYLAIPLSWSLAAVLLGGGGFAIARQGARRTGTGPRAQVPPNPSRRRPAVMSGPMPWAMRCSRGTASTPASTRTIFVSRICTSVSAIG